MVLPPSVRCDCDQAGPKLLPSQICVDFCGRVVDVVSRMEVDIHQTPESKQLRRISLEASVAMVDHMPLWFVHCNGSSIYVGWSSGLRDLTD